MTPHNMMTSLQAIPFPLTTACYLLLGAWVIARRRTPAQRLYGVLCIATCLWQGIWAVLFSAPNEKWLYFALQSCYSGIVFIPAIFYHFIVVFTGQENRKRLLPWAYGTSAVLATSVWIDHLFLDGFHKFSWGLAAMAGPFHPLFSVLVTGGFLRTLLFFDFIPVDSTPPAVQPRSDSL